MSFSYYTLSLERPATRLGLLLLGKMEINFIQRNVLWTRSICRARHDVIIIYEYIETRHTLTLAIARSLGPRLDGH